MILRNVLENPAWYTAYTPYQPEISQGRLEALVNFQTMICDLTAMAIANASMLDEATAAAEAMTLCRRVSRAIEHGDLRRGRRVSADDRCRADERQAAGHHGHRRTRPTRRADADCFAVLLQYPGADGDVRDYRALAARLHAKGALVIAATDLLALTMLTPPGEWGADVVVGSSQRFGVPMGFGGPHAAFLATRDEFKRSLPGRLVGVSVDANGDPAYRLALQTREQHIRREKATSNICTAQVLLAVIASMYAVYHGPQGLATIAARVHRLTGVLRAGLAQLGLDGRQRHVFRYADHRHRRAHRRDPRAGDRRARQSAPDRRGAHRRVAGRNDDARSRAAAVDDLRAGGRRAARFRRASKPTVVDAFPPALSRTTPFLTHPTFNRYHSETAMLRYLRRLADKDIALDRAMIPLGSCTMKLNATTRDDPGDLARVRAHASVRARQPDGRLSRDDRRARAHAVRGHRLCGGLAAAQRRLAGRVRGPA